MNTERTNRTWLAHDKIYVGPSFVLEDGSMEFPPEGGKATIYAASGKSEATEPAATIPDLPTLANWSWRDAAPERACRRRYLEVDFLTGPQPMETYDSFQNRYGWYRATLHADKAGPVSLHFGGQMNRRNFTKLWGLGATGLVLNPWRFSRARASGGTERDVASEPNADDGPGRNRMDTPAGRANREAAGTGAGRPLQRPVAGGENPRSLLPG